ncbi:PREDICTED: uncharacterized protein LOC105556257, partial [Vollenhovia emeryi]|uniref:uncharacterized protein LOC105556257 n=1 Tax=Vollenhovia emeryi TaxID=411798 RepID=UPI0005F50D19
MFADTYESALEAEKKIAATSDSEVESRIGKRKIKNNKYENYVNYPNPPRLVSFKESQKSSIASVSTHTNKDVELNNLQINLQDIQDKDDNIILAGDNIDDIPIIIPSENHIDFNFTDLETILKNIATEIQSMKEKQEQLLSEIQETTKLILAKINSEQYGKEYSMLTDDKIREYFPLTSIQNFLDFDTMLKNDEEAFMQVVNKILQIGGKNERDFIKRALTTTFDDNLACICSWTGQKNNFKIGDARIILSIKKAFKTTFPRSTEKDFEHIVMEWFRFANVRKQKKELS